MQQERFGQQGGEPNDLAQVFVRLALLWSSTNVVFVISEKYNRL